MENCPYKCDSCHRSYGTMTSLRWHKKNMHERVKCEVCGQEICNGWVMEFLTWGFTKKKLMDFNEITV